MAKRQQGQCKLEFKLKAVRDANFVDAGALRSRSEMSVCPYQKQFLATQAEHSCGFSVELMLMLFAIAPVMCADSNAAVRSPESAYTGATEPPGSTLVLPSPNECQSDYDWFYMAEPGVYAYWGLCEKGSNPSIYDYAGRFDLSPESNAWSSGASTIQGGVAGPVPDGETADQVTTASSFIANQDIPMNTNQGTLAVWANTDSTNTPMPMIYLEPVTGRGKSLVSIQAITPSNSECFTGTFGNAYGSSFTTPAVCGYVPNTCHRVVFTWSENKIKLYVDGIAVSNYWYGGELDDTVFVYRLFPESDNTAKQMTLAKALIANQAWSESQVKADYKPAFVLPPFAGVYVTSQLLGVVHEMSLVTRTSMLTCRLLN